MYAQHLQLWVSNNEFLKWTLYLILNLFWFIIHECIFNQIIVHKYIQVKRFIFHDFTGLPVMHFLGNIAFPIPVYNVQAYHPK